MLNTRINVSYAEAFELWYTDILQLYKGNYWKYLYIHKPPCGRMSNWITMVTSKLQIILGYPWIPVPPPSRLRRGRPKESPGWLDGLGVWFVLWVREVPGSNPGQAQNFRFLVLFPFFCKIESCLLMKILSIFGVVPSSKGKG